MGFGNAWCAFDLGCDVVAFAAGGDGADADGSSIGLGAAGVGTKAVRWKAS